MTEVRSTTLDKGVLAKSYSSEMETRHALEFQEAQATWKTIGSENRESWVQDSYAGETSLPTKRVTSHRLDIDADDYSWSDTYTYSYAGDRLVENLFTVKDELSVVAGLREYTRSTKWSGDELKRASVHFDTDAANGYVELHYDDGECVSITARTGQDTVTEPAPFTDEVLGFVSTLWQTAGQYESIPGAQGRLSVEEFSIHGSSGELDPMEIPGRDGCTDCLLPIPGKDDDM
jgi:hypothetical protein